MKNAKQLLEDLHKIYTSLEEAEESIDEVKQRFEKCINDTHEAISKIKSTESQVRAYSNACAALNSLKDLYKDLYYDDLAKVNESEEKPADFKCSDKMYKKLKAFICPEYLNDYKDFDDETIKDMIRNENRLARKQH